MASKEGVLELILTHLRPERARSEPELRFLAAATAHADAQGQVAHHQDLLGALVRAAERPPSASLGIQQACVDILRNLAFSRSNRTVLHLHAFYVPALLQLSVHADNTVRCGALEALWALTFHSSTTDRAHLWARCQALAPRWQQLAPASSPVFADAMLAIPALCGHSHLP